MTKDLGDFEGFYKYKLIMPMILLCTWIGALLGIHFFPDILQDICVGFLIYFSVRTSLAGLMLLYAVIKNNQAVAHAGDQRKRNYLPANELNEQIFHAFVIPIDGEDIKLISQTVSVLASHKRAQTNYMIFLALDMNEQSSLLKAKKIIEEFGSKFKYMNYTRHELRPYEEKGKASKISWCAEQMQEKFQEIMVPAQNVFLTIIDMDSWAPDVYFDLVEEQIFKDFENRHLFIFQPPQIFTRNNFDVSVVNRVYDCMHSSMHLTFLNKLYGVSLSQTNYTLSFNLIKRVGFWDTVSEAMGQDVHMIQKIMWKTQGQAITIPIYTPFNQLNVATGKGRWADIKARFWQAEKHARSTPNLAYTFKMFLSQPFIWNTFKMTYLIFEIVLLPNVMPWVAIVYNYQVLFLGKYSDAPASFISRQTFNYFSLALSLGSLLVIICYEIIKRRTTAALYKIRNQSVIRMVETFFFTLINVFIITMPATICASINSLRSNKQEEPQKETIDRPTNIRII